MGVWQTSGGADVRMFRAQAVGGARLAADASRCPVREILHLFLQRAIAPGAAQGAFPQIAAERAHGGKALQEHVAAQRQQARAHVDGTAGQAQIPGAQGQFPPPQPRPRGKPHLAGGAGIGTPQDAEHPGAAVVQQGQQHGVPDFRLQEASFRPAGAHDPKRAGNEQIVAVSGPDGS